MNNYARIHFRSKSKKTFVKVDRDGQFIETMRVPDEVGERWVIETRKYVIQYYVNISMTHIPIAEEEYESMKRIAKPFYKIESYDPSDTRPRATTSQQD